MGGEEKKNSYICELKPMNCDCTPEAKELFWLKESIEESQDAEIEAAERRGAERMLEVFLSSVSEGDLWRMQEQRSDGPETLEEVWAEYERLKEQNR